jgi:hypothetical protein
VQTVVTKVVLMARPLVTTGKRGREREEERERARERENTVRCADGGV